MKVLEVVKEYCFGQGLPLPSHEDGVVVEMLLGTQPILLDYRPDAMAVFLRAPLSIGEMKQPELAALYRRLLAANLLGLRFDGACFAIDADEGILELQARLDARTMASAPVLEAAIARLYGATCAAAELLSAPDPIVPGSGRGAPDDLLRA